MTTAEHSEGYPARKRRYLIDPDVPCEICGKSLPASQAIWMHDETACCPPCHPDHAPNAPAAEGQRMIKAEYIDHMGDDLRVANAARVSFAKESEWECDHFTGEDDVCLERLSDRDARLIAYLAREDHFTPFAHCVITLRETVPIFVARQRFKHQVGFTYNEVSRRYVDDVPEFYEPEVWRKRAENVKQGSSDEAVEMGHKTREAVTYYAKEAVTLYKELLRLGTAPEQARMVLPQSMLTSYYVTGSLAAFARACGLRTHPTAQREIQDLAAQWDTLIRPLFPVSWAALVGGVAV